MSWWSSDLYFRLAPPSGQEVMRRDPDNIISLAPQATEHQQNNHDAANDCHGHPHLCWRITVTHIETRWWSRTRFANCTFTQESSGCAIWNVDVRRTAQSWLLQTGCVKDFDLLWSSPSKEDMIILCALGYQANRTMWQKSVVCIWYKDTNLQTHPRHTSNSVLQCLSGCQTAAHWPESILLALKCCVDRSCAFASTLNYGVLD